MPAFARGPMITATRCNAQQDGFPQVSFLRHLERLRNMLRTARNKGDLVWQPF
jgi:hypothetical protein